MDADRFDTIARVIGFRTSRRLAVGLVATGLLSLTVPDTVAAHVRREAVPRVQEVQAPSVPAGCDADKLHRRHGHMCEGDVLSRSARVRRHLLRQRQEMQQR